MRKTVCFAYFGDGKFIGWYSDTFGTLTDNSPKLYGYSEQQVTQIFSSFENAMKRLHIKSDIADSLKDKIKYVEGTKDEDKKNHPALTIVDSSIDANKKQLSEYKTVELRIVECPEYDGPNPKYNQAKYKKWVKKEKVEKGENFRYANCPKELDSWIYCDYAKVKAWASIEPKEFFAETICYTCFNNLTNGDFVHTN